MTPRGWQALLPDVVAGFGSRTLAPPPDVLGPTRQVHGAKVVGVSSDGMAETAIACDGLAGNSMRPLGVRTADCVPLLFASVSQPWVAAVHAGWRGTVAKIAAEAVASAEACGVRVEDILVALGPSIGPCCYEVGDDVADRFRDAGLAPDVTTGSKSRLDLRKSNRRVLEARGVRPDRIQEVGPCTRCEAGRFFSHRANPVDPGRQWSWVALREPEGRGVSS